ncbi:MAG: hypothetical protein ABR505_09065 [Actinomycetota bacterium]
MRQPAPAAIAITILLSCSTATAPPASSTPLKRAPKCPMFPTDNHWNLKVDELPVLENSDAIIANIGADQGLHPDFGSGLYEGARIGIPFTVVPRDQPKVRIRYTAYGDESDPGPFPIPPNAPIEGGRQATGDRHVLVVDRGRCRLYELYRAFPVNGGASWKAASGATWDLESNALRPKDWTSADAAGLPILPGLARYDEVATGVIDHALRFTVSQTRREYIYPARHFASDSDDPDLPAMGQRLRLKADFDISGFSEQARVILQALKTYGMIVADNGSDWFISGTPNGNWDNDALREIGDVLGENFDVVNTSQLPKPTA